VSDYTNERGNSIIETSLTELAFIFFFILLIFSAWKINEISVQLESNTEDKSVLETKIEKLKATLISASEFFAIDSNVSPEELFDELTLGRKAVLELDETKQELELVTSSLNEIVEASSSKNAEKIAQEIRDIEKVKELISEKGLGDKTLSEALENVVKQNADFKGQNKNLRNKIEKLGNGLDHPPCWADAQTGAIQYVFNIIINEDSIEVLQGWPEKRKKEALTNPNINTVLGIYPNNSSFWLKSNGLFQESVQQECRHFVRVYDHAKSKSAFKNYLLGIENHYYKYLRTDQFVK
jgi:hypothetical protein